jgi:hypothetical protein
MAISAAVMVLLAADVLLLLANRDDARQERGG